MLIGRSNHPQAMARFRVHRVSALIDWRGLRWTNATRTRRRWDAVSSFRTLSHANLSYSHVYLREKLMQDSGKKHIKKCTFNPVQAQENVIHALWSWYLNTVWMERFSRMEHWKSESWRIVFGQHSCAICGYKMYRLNLQMHTLRAPGVHAKATSVGKSWPGTGVATTFASKHKPLIVISSFASNSYCNLGFH